MKPISTNNPNDKTQTNSDKYNRNNSQRTNKKTIKKRPSISGINKMYYFVNFENTKLLPKTQIIDYLFYHYKRYNRDKQLMDESKKAVLELKDIFVLRENDFPLGLKKNKIDLTLSMNPKTPLDKLISYCFYIKQPSIFKGSQKNMIELIKLQIGKDAPRNDITINGKMYDGSYYSSNAENKYKVADMFYELIINEYYNAFRNVNLNIINKIALLSVQNVYGLISDIITIELFNILRPEMFYMMSASKDINIVIQRRQVSMEFYFKCKLLITQEGNDVNPEYPCGDMEFVFFVDILKRKYELKKFILDYDIKLCGPTDVSRPTDADETPENLAQGSQENPRHIRPEVAVPAALATVGIATTPFLLALLGGRNKRTRKNKRNK